ncbi:MAG TPA: hypothetical protein VFX29_06210 [Longimicrobiaceae bacterium]|jgi:hypothetical protein|nr:hypothetical protein [Longimicrobiaceae bacterium]
MDDDRRPNVEGHDLTEERPVQPSDEVHGVERGSVERPRPRVQGEVAPEEHPDPAMQGTPQPDGDPGKVARSGGLQSEPREPDLDH